MHVPVDVKQARGRLGASLERAKGSSAMFLIESSSYHRPKDEQNTGHGNDEHRSQSVSQDTMSGSGIISS